MVALETKIIRSTPVIRTGVCPHTYRRHRPVVTQLPKLCTFWPWGLTPGPKFTKRGDDLPSAQVYHIAKFHHPASTHAGYYNCNNIRYKSICGQTKLHTVNDIFPACLSARGDNKYASCPDWSPPHMPIARPVCHTWLYGCPMLYRFFHILALWLTPQSKFTKLDGDLQQALLRHRENLQPYHANGL